MADNREIAVCFACLTAACWYGEFRCNEYRDAGIVEMRVPALIELGRKHPGYWSAKKMAEVYGVGSREHGVAVAAEIELELGV